MIDLSFQRLYPRNPQTRRLVVLDRFVFLLALEGAFIVALWAFAVTMMRLVVDDDDVLQRHQLAAGALQHRTLGFDGDGGLAPALQQSAADLGHLHDLALAERVIVGDDDLRLGDVYDEIGRDKFAGSVIALRVLGPQDAQAVADGDAGGDDQEALAEPAAARRAHGVRGMPGDEHRHDSRLAGPGRHFHREAKEFGVRRGVAVFEMSADRAVARRIWLRPPSAR